MTKQSSESRFRKAAQAEDGEPVSAGARVAHVRLATESGRVVVVDLAGVPDAERPALIAEIKNLVDKARATASPSANAATQ
jgi:hypothetical protein